MIQTEEEVPLLTNVILKIMTRQFILLLLSFFFPLRIPASRICLACLKKWTIKFIQSQLSSFPFIKSALQKRKSVWYTIYYKWSYAGSLDLLSSSACRSLQSRADNVNNTINNLNAISSNRLYIISIPPCKKKI